jgi:hypothetical protein
MAYILNKSTVPVRFISYRVDRLRFGNDTATILPRECRWVNPEPIWHNFLITAFTENTVSPQQVEVTGVLESLGQLNFGIAVQIMNAKALASMIVGRDSEVWFEVNENGTGKFTIRDNFNDGDGASCLITRGS